MVPSHFRILRAIQSCGQTRAPELALACHCAMHKLTATNTVNSCTQNKSIGHCRLIFPFPASSSWVVPCHFQRFAKSAVDPSHHTESARLPSVASKSAACVQDNKSDTTKWTLAPPSSILMLWSLCPRALTSPPLHRHQSQSPRQKLLRVSITVCHWCKHWAWYSQLWPLCGAIRCSGCLVGTNLSVPPPVNTAGELSEHAQRMSPQHLHLEVFSMPPWPVLPSGQTLVSFPVSA